MPTCVYCGEPLVCRNESSHTPAPSGDGVQPCSLKKGAIWVHVIDDVANDVSNCAVELDGNSKPTDPSGISNFDPLDKGKYPVTLTALTTQQAKLYDPPETTEETVGVRDGEITYLVFELKRRGKLRLKVQEKGKTTRILKGAKVTVSGKEDIPETETSAETGIADFEDRSAGNYSITLAVPEKNAKYYKLPEAPVSVSLAPGADHEEVIVIPADVRVEVGLHFKDDDSPVPSARLAVYKGTTLEAEAELADGAAVVKPLDVESYEITFPEIDGSEWDLAQESGE